MSHTSLGVGLGHIIGEVLLTFALKQFLKFQLQVETTHLFKRLSLDLRVTDDVAPSRRCS